MSCSRCGSWAINHGHHGRDGSDPELCDVCYWRKRTEAKDAELAGYIEANRYMKGELDDALEDARKYCEAKREIARLRDALLGASCHVTDFWSKTLSDGNRRLQQMLLNLDPDRFSDEELQK